MPYDHRNYTISGRIPRDPEFQRFGVDLWRADRSAVLVVDFSKLETRVLAHHLIGRMEQHDVTYFPNLEMSPRDFEEKLVPVMKKIQAPPPPLPGTNRHARRKQASLEKKK